MARSPQAAPVFSAGLNLLSAWFCPFAQRTWIALEEKGLPYELHEVALKDTSTGQWFQLDEKPEWWLRLNPLGKVPVLAVKDGENVQSVSESSICNEFLEDYGSGKAPLLPAEPLHRAHARIVIDRFSSQLMPQFYRILVRQDKKDQDECAQKIIKEIRWLEGDMDEGGPFFLGPHFSLVDAAVAPWFLRMPILKYYRGLEMPRDTPKLQRWQEAVMSRPSVRATQKHPEGLDYEEELLKHYSKYADATAKSTSAHDFK